LVWSLSIEVELRRRLETLAATSMSGRISTDDGDAMTAEYS